ncbi:unnamed protein product [Arabidopsis halleri]
MLQTLGDDLGEVMDMEITPATTKIRVLIDGLQPLIKETVVEFSEGTEALVTLDYKNLKNHYLYCHRLSHEKKDCPGLTHEKEGTRKNKSKILSPGSKAVSRNYYAPSDNFVAPRNKYGEGDFRPSRDFHNPLKRKADSGRDRDNSLTEVRSHSQPNSSQRFSSGRSFDHIGKSNNRAVIDFPLHRRDTRHSQGKNLQCRERTPTLSRSFHEFSDSSRPRRPPLERHNNTQEISSTPPVIPTKEQVMGELREVTVQYTTCADPTESATRKQRVLQGEAKHLMSNTADQIIVAVVNSSPSL